MQEIMGFWGLHVLPDRTYTQVVDASFKLSMAALGEDITGDERSSLKVTINRKDFILCSLTSGKLEQQPLNVVFTEGEEITFSVTGKNSMHLTGNYLPDNGDDEMEEDLYSFGLDEEDDDGDGDDSDDGDETDDDDNDDDYTEKLNKRGMPVIQTRGAKRLATFDPDAEDDDPNFDDVFSIGSVEDDESEGEEAKVMAALAAAKKRAAKQDSNDGAKKMKLEPQAGDKKVEEEKTPVKPNAAKKEGKKTPAKSDKKQQSEDTTNDKTFSKTDDKKQGGNIAKTPSKNGDKKQDDNVVKTPSKNDDKKQGDKKQNNKTPSKNDGNKQDDNVAKTSEKNNDKNQSDNIAKTPGKKGDKKQDDNVTKTPGKKGDKKQEESVAKTPAKRELQNGLVIEDVKIGEGPKAKAGKRVSMRYIGKLTNGKVFDKNTSGSPFSFNLGSGEVIKGWDIGIAGMAVGGERRLIIPPALGYGAKGAPPDIPKNATLEFEVKLLSIK